MSRARLTALAVSAGLLAALVAGVPATAEPATTPDVGVTTEETATLDTGFALLGEPAPDADPNDEVTVLGRYGNTFPRDSDGQVPAYFGNYTGCSDGILGRSSYVRSGGVTRWQIRYDTCEMRRLGAGPNDWARLKAHERAHTRGWGHWETPRSDNPAYYPRVRICRC